jgi:mannose-1-phosphate guanylyltransferase/phosphomannomutase
VFPPRALEFYTAALEASVDADALRRRSFKVVLDYSSGAASVVMPYVLGKIGASVLAVNPYAATVGATVDDFETRVKILGDLVRTSGSDLGLVFDPDGETAVIIDDEGTALTSDQALIVMVELVCSTIPNAHIALPVSVSREVERIAERHGASITWTKLSATHLMEVSQQRGIDLAASQEGGFIWPAFLPAYDAAATLAHLLGLLALADRTLSATLASMPATHVAHESVPTPWERKGAVMRGMVERAAGHPTVLVDGVKIVYPEGWALVLPDPEIAVTHVWADASTEAEARRLVAVHAGHVAELSA